MITLEEARANIGRGVVYQVAGSPPEWGVITMVSERMAFVRYRNDIGSKATTPAQLTFGYLTKTGRVLTDEQIERLAEEAEENAAAERAAAVNTVL